MRPLSILPRLSVNCPFAIKMEHKSREEYARIAGPHIRKTSQLCRENLHPYRKEPRLAQD